MGLHLRLSRVEFQHPEAQAYFDLGFGQFDHIGQANPGKAIYLILGNRSSHDDIDTELGRQFERLPRLEKTLLGHVGIALEINDLQAVVRLEPSFDLIDDALACAILLETLKIYDRYAQYLRRLIESLWR